MKKETSIGAIYIETSIDRKNAVASVVLSSSIQLEGQEKRVFFIRMKPIQSPSRRSMMEIGGHFAKKEGGKK
ncbi:hypothetical protein BSM4216_2318 [Bacillus smithii]|nr:hypothetical protein BSM4216_2318 [Bacillus smithii]